MRAISYIFIISIVLSVYSCQETNPILPDAYTLNGVIDFGTDSNFALGGTGQYVVVAWPKSTWYPMGGSPMREQTIDIRRENNRFVMSYIYRLAQVNSGSYVVSLQYIDGSSRKILGIYGCNLPLDSQCLKTPTKFATIVTTEGLLNINVNSRADTSVVIQP